MGLDSHEAMLLWRVAAEDGLSQRKLSAGLGVQASHLVGMIDRLARRGLLERRRSAADRRVNAIVLTSKGRRSVTAILKIGRQHDEEITRGLTRNERTRLTAVLQQVASVQGLLERVHPGFSPGRSDAASRRAKASDR